MRIAYLPERCIFVEHFATLDVIINNKELETLFVTGKSRKLRLPSAVIDKFFITIQKIEAAQTIHDLWGDNGLRFEKLKGHKTRHSMRLAQKYRLEMEIGWQNQEKTVGRFYLEAVSNHYDD